MKLLLVDEEIPQRIDEKKEFGTPRKDMWYYLQALHKGDVDFEVARSVDKAMQILTERPAEFDMVSIDEIMPVGEAFGLEETENSLRTGTSLLNWINENKLNLHIVILSNVPKKKLDKELNKCSFEHIKSLTVFNKPTTDPFEFIDAIHNIRNSEDGT